MRTDFRALSIPKKPFSQVMPWRKAGPSMVSCSFGVHRTHIAVGAQLILQAQPCGDFVNHGLYPAIGNKLASGPDLKNPAGVAGAD